MNTILFANLVAFFVFLLILRSWINFQKSKGIGKYIRKEGPSSHFQKSGTPVMGGIIFLIASIPFLFFKETFFLSLSTILFGLLGLLDDFKLMVNRDYGIRPLRKIFLSFVITLLLYIFSPHDYRIYWGSKLIISSEIFYVILFFVIFIAVPNAINLTDGLDGLAGGTSLITLFFFLIYNFQFNNKVILEISLMITALIAFLWFNSHPAEIFMGDVGAFALGGFIACLSIINKVELLLVFLGGIFLIESLSVFIQVFFYKWKKRRVFLMSPIHHHFELKGWKETKVVWRFYIIHLIMMIGGIILWSLT